MRVTIRCSSGLRLEFEGELLEFLAFDRFLSELAQLERGLEDLRVTDVRAEPEEPAQREPEPAEPLQPPPVLDVETRVDRRHGRTGALWALEQLGGAGTAAEVSELCGVKTPTASNTLGNLVDDGVVERAGSRPRRGGTTSGRRPVLFALVDAPGGGDPSADTGADTPPADLATDSVGNSTAADEPGDTGPSSAPSPELVDCDECGAELAAVPGECCPDCRRSHELLDLQAAGLGEAAGNGEAEPRSPAAKRTPPPPRAPLTELEQRIVELVHRHGPVTPIWIADQVTKHRRDVGVLMRDLEQRGHLADTGGGWYEIPTAGEAQAA